MIPTVALCVSALFILWLFTRDPKQRAKVSSALWIPLIWVFILGSRPVSLLLGVGGTSVNLDGSLNDGLIDKALFLFLIAAGSLVLLKRRLNWRSIILHNKWLFLYFLCLGISVVWSDSPFVSFKRWIKDYGNVVMVLVVLSERNPIEAVKVFLSRYFYLMIPLSVVTIRYYPAISRKYQIWTNQPVFVGLSLNKNLLGMTLFVCGLSLFWVILVRRDAKVWMKDKTALFGYSILTVMTAWLLVICHSATALSCTVVGSCALLALRAPAVRRKVKRLGTYAVGLLIVVVLLQTTGLWGSFMGTFTQIVGRDPKMHGRAEIWEAVLKEDINPLIGTGFYSFWSNERNRRLSETYYYQLGEAHNGYIETYLNNGLIGLSLLIAAIASAAASMKRDVLNGSLFGALRLVFLITLVIYNVTESVFDRLTIVWFIMLLVMMEYQWAVEPPLGNMRASSGDTLRSALGGPAPVGP